MELKRDLLIPDQHFPFNDPLVWKVYLAVARGLAFSNIITIGDFLDCGAVSSHPVPARGNVLLFDEIDAGNVGLDELTEAGRVRNKKCRFHWLDGNHEYRLANYLANTAPALKGLVGTTITEAMRLTERGWTYTPYRSHLQLGNVYLTHDVKKRAGAMAHRQAVNMLHVNVIHGHTHRLAVQYEGSIDGIPRYGAMLGWGGSIEAATSYQDELSIRAESVHGFGILYRWKTADGQPRSRIDAVPVFEGSAVVEGAEFG